MPPLKEIKDRIGSVKGTLKITSAMKMVASAKLHKAQQAVAGMLPYQEVLHRMLATLSSGPLSFRLSDSLSFRLRAEGPHGEISSPDLPPRVLILAVASNSSLCGAFNANVVRKLRETMQSLANDGIPEENITVIPLGRKIGNYSHLIDHPSFAEAAAFADKIIDGFKEGKFNRVDLVYNHYVSTASQVPTHETWLPFEPEISPRASLGRNDNEQLGRNDNEQLGRDDSDRLWLLEPSREELLEALLPKLIRLKLFSVLLDSVAAEHAARTVAMQMATDNGEDMLEELTLEYNKGRQQKITAEILDIVGGSMQE